MKTFSFREEKRMQPDNSERSSNDKEKQTEIINNFISAASDEWIKEFGSLNDDHERNGYFLLGFLHEVKSRLTTLDWVVQAKHTENDGPIIVPSNQIITKGLSSEGHKE